MFRQSVSEVTQIGETELAVLAVSRDMAALALDCEFVGRGALGHLNALARVSIVDAEGRVLLDTLVDPASEDWPITDYRTWISGIGPGDLSDAPRPEAVVPTVERLLAGNLLVGHGLHSDLDALGITHPTDMIRDSLTYPPFQKLSKVGHAADQAHVAARSSQSQDARSCAPRPDGVPDRRTLVR